MGIEPRSAVYKAEVIPTILLVRHQVLLFFHSDCVTEGMDLGTLKHQHIRRIFSSEKWAFSQVLELCFLNNVLKWEEAIL